MVKWVKVIKEDVIVFVDNCYGEFMEKCELIEVGVDLMVGLLIKNFGGGFVEIGGYICGKEKYV